MVKTGSSFSNDAFLMTSRLGPLPSGSSVVPTVLIVGSKSYGRIKEESLNIFDSH